jgi:hypothetical protein
LLTLLAQLANDNIIGGVLMVGSLLGALVVGGVGALLSILWPTLGYDALTLFLIGFVVCVSYFAFPE